MFKFPNIVLLLILYSNVSIYMLTYLSGVMTTKHFKKGNREMHCLAVFQVLHAALLFWFHLHFFLFLEIFMDACKHTITLA